MDYKTIIKSRKLRCRILEWLSFIPDEMMLKIQYRIKNGKKLNLENPQRFTEKLQWYKLHYHNPLLHKCVDKYQVREYVASKGYSKILTKLIAKFNDISEIDWDSLPNSFVMKTTNGGGGLNVVLCYDKKNLNFYDLKEKLKSTFIKSHSGGREWAYYGLKPGIIVEELLINSDNPEAGINDYKFFCYNGKVRYIVVDLNRYVGHERSFYDVDWNNLNIGSDCARCDTCIPKPENFNEMVEIAEELSNDFPFVRVDLYNIRGKIYFGELTFYPWSGYVIFEPDSFDYELGELFIAK